MRQPFFRNRVIEQICPQHEIADIRFEQACRDRRFKIEVFRCERQEAGKDEPEHQEVQESLLCHVVDENPQKRRHQIQADDDVHKPQVVVDVIAEEQLDHFLPRVGFSEFVYIVSRVDRAPE